MEEQHIRDGHVVGGEEAASVLASGTLLACSWDVGLCWESPSGSRGALRSAVRLKSSPSITSGDLC